VTEIPAAATLEFAEGVRLHRNVLIPMSDGVRLAADVYAPAGAAAEAYPGPWPVVIDYIPYRKDELRPQLLHTYIGLARAGYALVRIDIRGTGASEGVNIDEYTPQEQADGVEAIEWLAAQPWCDGHVNITGISYGGFTALQLASYQPPHLTSIIPIDFTDDRYTDDCHYRGGLMRMYYDVSWYGTRMIAWGAMPADPDAVGSQWARTWEEHIEQNEPYLLNWLAHQVDGPYWRNGSVGANPTITCPTFLIGGWADGYMNPPLRLYQNLSCPKKLLIGPWNHALPDGGIPGPRIDYIREMVRWLDYWNRGIETGIMAEPPVQLFVQHWQPVEVDRIESAGEWRAEVEWPAPGATERALHLAAGGTLADVAAADEGGERLDYVPTVGIAGGLWSAGVPFGLPGDQRPDEAFSLTFTTDPLTEPLTIIGRAVATLHLETSATVLGFSANLSDVAPDGSSHLVSKGMLNATRRASLTDPASIAPGEPLELTVEIDATAWRFDPGHRIRLTIANADFPNIWPTPETATSTVFHGGARPSRLMLPVVPDRGSAPAPTFAPSPLTVSRHTAAVRPPRWEIATDVLTGRVTSTIEIETEFRVDERTTIKREWGSVCTVAPSDPGHASARGWFQGTIHRANQGITGRTDTVIQSTPTDFHVTIDLELRVNDRPHASRRWVQSFPRRLL
jgi:putative CocE/NonD family hydrolase